MPQESYDIYQKDKTVVTAVCRNLDAEHVELEVDDYWCDGVATIKFDTIDDMIQLATDMKLWAMQLKAMKS